MSDADSGLPTSPELDRIRTKLDAAKKAAADITSTINTTGITLKLDAEGKLSGLSFTSQALRQGPNALAELIVDTYRRADEQYRESLRRAYSDVENDPAVRAARTVTESFLGAGQTESPPTQTDVDDPDSNWIEQRGGSIYDRW